MKAVTPITISTNRLPRRKTRDSMRVRRATCTCHSNNPTANEIRPSHTLHTAQHHTQLSRLARNLRCMSNRRQSQSNRAQLWQIIAFPTKPYAKYVLWISLRDRFMRLRIEWILSWYNSYSVAFAAIILTSYIYWHSMSLRKVRLYALNSQLS